MEFHFVFWRLFWEVCLEENMSETEGYLIKPEFQCLITTRTGKLQNFYGLEMLFFLLCKLPKQFSFFVFGSGTHSTFQGLISTKQEISERVSFEKLLFVFSKKKLNYFFVSFALDCPTQKVNFHKEDSNRSFFSDQAGDKKLFRQIVWMHEVKISDTRKNRIIARPWTKQTFTFYKWGQIIGSAKKTFFFVKKQSFLAKKTF